MDRQEHWDNTFALDGPEKCSGLPVCRYDAPRLAAEFERDFALVREQLHTHVTPSGKLQKFSFALLRRN